MLSIFNLSVYVFLMRQLINTRVAPFTQGKKFLVFYCHNNNAWISLYEQFLQLCYFSDLIRSIPPAEPDLVMAKPAVSEEKEVSKLGTCAVALYDYQAADDTEISFDPDQV